MYRFIAVVFALLLGVGICAVFAFYVIALLFGFWLVIQAGELNLTSITFIAVAGQFVLKNSIKFFNSIHDKWVQS